jgi:hypothetical protein
MINAAIVGASLGSAMKYASPALDRMGYDSRAFMLEVMGQLGGQGVPGAEHLMSPQFLVAQVSTGSSVTPGGQGISGQGYSLT